MPIVMNQLIPANAGQPGYAVAKELARQTIAQFGAVRWLGVGIAGGSCCAALAVNPNPVAGFPASQALINFIPAAPPGVFAVPNFGGLCLTELFTEIPNWQLEGWRSALSEGMLSGQRLQRQRECPYIHYQPVMTLYCL